MTKLLRGPVFWLLLAIAFTPFVLTVGPAIETRFFPVFTKFEIASVSETADGGSLVVVKFTKARYCEPAGYAWFMGRRDAGQFSEIEVRSVTMGNSVGRPVGSQTSAPFEVAAKPEDLNHVFVNVFSRCPFQPWITKSEVYP